MHIQMFLSRDRLRLHLHRREHSHAAHQDEPVSRRRTGVHGHEVEYRFGRVREEIQDVRGWRV